MDREEDELERAFAAARRHAPVISEELLARIAAAAPAPPAAPGRAAPAVPAGRGILDRLRAALGAAGGVWGGAGGLVAAALAGVWIGYSGTGSLGDLAASFWGNEPAAAVELMPGLEIFALSDVEG